jgi:putative alpha-1,2-mannosidase
MSAWYLFSAMGFYPVDPASATYVVGTPFFDYIALDLPAGGTIRVTAKGASGGKKKYIKSLTIDGRPHKTVIIDHAQLAHGADLVFEMSDTPQTWPAN